MVKTSLDAEANSNVHSLAFFRGVNCAISKSRNAHKRAAAPQHATNHGDRGARGPSGSCSANSPGGCRIFANYCCSVRVSARGANLRPNLETTSGEEIPCPDLRLDRDETHPFSVYFLILEVVRTIIRLHMQCTQILL